MCFIYVRGHSKEMSVAYVSSSNGNDFNKGSIETPFRSIQRALELGADTILLKSGDVFYEKIDLDGSFMDKYGEGEKPRLLGVKIPQPGAWENGVLIDGKWTKCKSCIWRVDLSLDDVKYSGFKTGGSSFFNNVGAIVNLTTDNMNNCRKVPRYSDMTENFDFWQYCPLEELKNTKPEDFDLLYLYFDGDPNEYYFGITMGTSAITLRNSTVCNLNIRYWGYGIDFFDNVRISGCDVDGIGGYIMIGNDKWALLGNGIGSWISPPKRSNCIIEGCNVSRTFDCGATIQGSNLRLDIKAENIIFSNNTFRNCCQTFEEFLRGSNNDNVYNNCIFEHNVSIDAGINTGFRYYDNRYKRCHYLCSSYFRNTGMIIRNNIAINGNYYCATAFDGYYRQAIWQDNVCKIVRGQDLLGNYRGTADVIKIPEQKGKFSTLDEATDSAIAKYRLLTGDNTTTFIIIE